MTFKDIIKKLSDLPQEKQQGIFDLVKNRCGGDIRKITPGDLDAARAEYMGHLEETRENIQSAPVDTVELNPLTDNTTVDDLIPRIEAALKDYNALNHVDDWKKETVTRWTGACMYIGKTIFKDTGILKDIYRRDEGSAMPTNYNAYDHSLLSDLLDYYASLCSRVNKPMTQWGFAFFIGTNSYSIQRFGEELTPESRETFKKCQKMVEGSWGDRALQQGGLLGMAAINYFLGWDKVGQQVKEDKISQLSVDSLPRLGVGEK